MPRYTMPGSEVVSIPITFFTRGWLHHQVLGNLGLLTATPGEITSTVTPRHEFGLDDKPLQQDAHHAVLAAVAATVDYLVERKSVGRLSNVRACFISYLKCPFVKRTAQARPDAAGGQ